MQKNNQLFIYTTDCETAQMLRRLGFQEIASDANSWTFLNDSTKIHFSESDMKKMHFCNKLNI